MRFTILAAGGSADGHHHACPGPDVQLRHAGQPTDPTFNQLLGINDSGTIVGYYGSGAAGHPNIGYEIASPYTSFTSDNMPGSTQTQATGINNAGLTTGFWAPTNLGGGDANFGFVRQAVGSNFTYTSATDPLVFTGPTVDQALGINNNNIAAGFYVDGDGNSHGYTYELGTSTYKELKLKARRRWRPPASMTARSFPASTSPRPAPRLAS